MSVITELTRRIHAGFTRMREWPHETTRVKLELGQFCLGNVAAIDAASSAVSSAAEPIPPQLGAIARCSRGELGVITVSVPNSDGYWIGVHVEAGSSKLGGKWMSKAPQVLGVIDPVYAGIISSMEPGGKGKGQ